MRTALLALAAASLVAACAARRDVRHGPPPAGAAWSQYPEEDVKGVRNPHDYGGAGLCQRCHVDGGKRLAAPDSPTLCVQCHHGAKMTHVGKVQTPRPPTLPYDDGGRIACHTCHDPHDVKARRYGFRAEYVKVCNECHAAH